MGEKLNFKLNEETEEALKKYKDAYNLNSQEEVIRQLLPSWAFNSYVPPRLGRLKEMTKNSHHYTFDLSNFADSSELYELKNAAERNGNTKLVSEIEEILNSHPQTEKQE
jgi:hypothetical protein